MICRRILVPAFFGLLAFSTQAHAGLFSFGNRDTLRFTAETTIKVEDGNTVYLARHLTVKSFILPYTVQDNGYVLGITGTSGKYLPLPVGARLQTLQANGFLPKPLPPFHFAFGDYLVGYALWWVLLAIVLARALIRKALGRGEYDGDEE